MARATSVPRVYIDTSLIFNVIKRERRLWPDSLKVLLAGERDAIELVSSTLLLAEVCGFRGDVDANKRDDVIDRFLVEQVTWMEVDLFVIREARKLADTHRLRGPDATHLASAVRFRAEYLMTRDKSFPIGTTVNGVRIRQPEPVWNETLDDVRVDDEAEQEEVTYRKVEERESRHTEPSSKKQSAPAESA